MKTILTLLLTCCAAFAQQKYTLKPTFTGIPQQTLLAHADSIFYFTTQVAYNVTMDYIRPYKDIVPDRNFRPGYIDARLRAVEKDPTDFLTNGDIAMYYQYKGEMDKATEYYRKALSVIKMLPKAKDSASYYSYRGMLKANLGQDANPDMERALRINKADSVAVVLYPLALVQQQRYGDARKVLTAVLNEKAYAKYAFLMLHLTDFYEKIGELARGEKSMNEQIRTMDVAGLAAMRYTDRIDAKDPDMVRINELCGLFYALFKFGAALEDKTILLTNQDLEFMAAKERYFKAWVADKKNNLYGGYVALGLIHFLQQKHDAAQADYQKALAVFPSDKEGYKFNTVEVYNNLAAIASRRKKWSETIDALEKKRAVKSITVDERQSALLGIAKLHLQLGNPDKANEYAREALALGANFEVNFLLSHIHLKMGTNLLADRYREKAGSNMSGDEICRFMDYLTTLYISSGQFDGAHDVYSTNMAQAGGMQCEECVKMMNRFLVLK